MIAKLRSWWQQIKQHRVAIGVVAIVLLVVISLVIAGYWFDWTGFNGYNKVTIAHTINGTNAGTVTRTEEYQPGRTLWDWLQLLIIPIALAVVGYLLNRAQQRRQQKIADDNRNTDLEIANTRQQEATLASYLAQMTDLLVGKHLRQSRPEGEVRDIARTQTLVTLRQLDGNRKGLVLRFLYEAGVLKRARDIIDLTTIDLRGTDLLQLLYKDNVLAEGEVTIDLTEVIENQADLSDSQTRLLQSLYETERIIKGIKRGKMRINVPRVRDDRPHLVGKEFDLLQSLYETGLMHRAKLVIDVTGTKGLGGVSLEMSQLYRLLLEADLLKRGEAVVDLAEANLCGTNCSGIILDDAELGRADLSGANLSEARLYGTSLCAAKLRSTNLYRAGLFRADLSRADLVAADLTSAHLSNAKLHQSKLYEAILKYASLEEAYLYEASLYNANLQGANLSRAQLVRANLSRADLRGAYLSNTPLAYLNEADFKEAKYNTKQIKEKNIHGELDILDPTEWPQGFDPKVAGAICVDC